MGLEAAQLLAELYAALRLFTNLFQPSFKLKSSLREGGRIKRQHHPPQTAVQQLLRTGVLCDHEAQGLREPRKDVTRYRFWPGCAADRAGWHCWSAVNIPAPWLAIN